VSVKKINSKAKKSVEKIKPQVKKPVVQKPTIKEPAVKEKIYVKPKREIIVTDWKNPKSKVSKYFTVEEVTSGDPRRIPKDEETKRRIKKLAINLDKLRDRFGRIKINSWYRPEPINSAVGGAKNSQHIQGWAADVEFVKDQREVEQWLEKNWVGGVGSGVISGKGFTHLDMGPNRRWKY
jgi:uncharacterized protein YcbK (DUF882 family)